MPGRRGVERRPQLDGRVSVGDRGRGRELIERCACRWCHLVPRVGSARGLVGRR